MSADIIEAAAVTVLSDALKSRNVDLGPLSAEMLVNLARQWIDVGVNMASNAAHREAERAGAERAAKVTDMESAEQAAKERK